MSRLTEILEQVPRISARLRPESYLGPCVVQAPGAWTRVGPTWLVPGLGWVVIGPGAADWGTTSGLAELASAPTASPKWHAVGVCVAPAPNVVLAVTASALSAEHYADVRELCAGAEDVGA